MCLILFALNNHENYKFVLAANRDEFFERPTIEADYWEENNSILGGRDLKSGGTWLGLTKRGRFIAITNYRDLKNERKNAKSRGELSKTYLSGEIDLFSFINEVSEQRNLYNGFNLILSDDCLDSVYHYSNVSNQLQKIENGTHGLSNHLLNTPWPKVVFGKKKLNNCIKTNSLAAENIFKLLENTEEADNDDLPNTGISFELEKKLSPVFISMKGYGTRCSTIIFADCNNNISFQEVTFNENRQIIGNKTYELMLKS